MFNKFFTKFLFIFLLSNLASAGDNGHLKFEPSQFSKNNEVVIEVWNGKEGLEKLNHSEYKNDFYQLANFFQTQINPFYCGVASGVIILNTIHAPKITSAINKSKNENSVTDDLLSGGVSGYLNYSQNDFLSEKTDKIKDRRIIEFKNITDKEELHDPGLNLADLAQIFKEVYQLKTEYIYAKNNDKKSIEKFRELVKKIVSDSDHFLIVNFDGKTIGLQSNGHHSPLVAYDKKTDAVLIMDVSYRRPWYWVPLDHLYKAMNTKDGNKYRGYLIISKKN